MREVTKEELNEWYEWCNQYRKGYHFSNRDWSDFVWLNHIIMEMCHEVHNHNMLKK